MHARRTLLSVLSVEPCGPAGSRLTDNQGAPWKRLQADVSLRIAGLELDGQKVRRDTTRTA